MQYLEKFKNDAFHTCLRFKNGLLEIHSLGEYMCSTRRVAVHRCALVFRRHPSQELLDTLNGLREYSPVGLSYAQQVNGVRVVVERFADRKSAVCCQNPFQFELYSKRTECVEKPK
jgi:hypothetical protein